MTLGWPWPILRQGQIWSLMIYMEKTVRKSFNGRNLHQMTRVTEGFCLYKNADPKGLSANAPGLYTCIKTWKIMYKIRLQRYFFETCNKWSKWQGFSVDIGFCPERIVCPCPGAIYLWRNIKKMCIKSDFKEICLKLATNGQSNKGFLLTSKVCPQMNFGEKENWRNKGMNWQQQPDTGIHDTSAHYPRVYQVSTF